MKRINSITYEEIGRLNDEQMVRLLHNLLHAEARQRGICKAGIHVPFNIVVADGGEDGRWDTNLVPSDYIPNPFTVYQSKAQNLIPSQCDEEVLQARDSDNAPVILKPKVQEVLQRGGCYCFFCNTHYVQKQIDERIEAVRKALALAGRPSPHKDHIVFLDANKIAEWVNLHSGAIAFVLECCGLARTDQFLSWDIWRKQRSDFEFPFETNAYLQGFIDKLRNHLLTPRSLARVVGQSGLGKTRLAFEVFRPVQTATSLNLLLSNSMVYFDIEAHDFDYYDIVRQLAQNGLSGIVVADNCSRPEHDKLSELVSMEGSQLSLLSLDYEPERIESRFLHVLIEPSELQDVIPRMLGHIDTAKKLSNTQREHIARYCQGFPQIAVLLAELDPQLWTEKMTEGSFAERLLWGRGGKDDDALRAVKSMSIFTHVGAEGDAASQLTFVSRELCPGFDETTFREKCQRFRKLRVIQSAGKYWFVTPKPLSVALAARWWEVTTTPILTRLLPLIEANNLVEPFCDQLRLLQCSENAKQIVQDLCASTAPFGSAEVVFSQTGSRLFRAIVEINPTAALMALQPVMADKTFAELHDLTFPLLNLVSALEKLCWEAELFPGAAPLLLKLAAAEDDGASDNATKQFKQLFQIFLSGTQQPALKRLDVIEAALQEPPPVQNVCIEALGVALHAVTGHYHRMGGVEVRGSNLPQKDWEPATFGEVAEYQLKAFLLLKNVILNQPEASGRAATELGKNLGTFFIPFYLDKIEPEIRQLAAHLGNYWPEARRSVEDAIQHARIVPAQPLDPRVKNLLEVLTPADWQKRVSQIVSQSGHHGYFDAKKQFIDEAAEQARSLGREIGRPLPNLDLDTILPDLLRGRHDQAFSFGLGLAETHPDPEALIQSCLAHFKNIPKKERWPELLAGILRFLRDDPIVKQTLQDVASDPCLCDLYTKLATLKTLTVDDLDCIRQLIVEKKIGAEEIRILSYGSVTDSLPPDEITSMLSSLIRDAPDTLIPAYEVVGMYTHGNPERKAQCKELVRSMIMTPGFVMALHGTFREHFWENDSKAFLDDPDGEEFALNQIEQIVSAQFDREYRSRSGSEAYRLVGLMLRKFPSQCWPVLGRAVLQKNYFLASDLYRVHTIHDAAIPGTMEREQFSCALWNLPADILIPWCQANPVAVPRLLEKMGLFITEPDGSFKWHYLVMQLLEACYKESYATTIDCNLFSFSSTGSRVPYLQRRIDLLRQLESHPKLPLRNLAAKLIPQFEDLKSEEQKRDEEFAKGIL